jgi:uncharacterized protein YqgC (DUF456 family)
VEILYAVLLVIFLLAGLIAVPFGFPGTFVILAAAFLYALVTEFAVITWQTLGVLLGAALLAEGAEAVTGLVGARRYGSGKLGVAASIVGGIAGAVLGAPILFGLGAIPGALAGAFGAAVLAELVQGRSSWEALRAGWGTFLGRLAGTAVKGVLAVAMAVICLQRVFG